MADVTITRSGELEVGGVLGETEAGVEFVDSYIPARRGAKMTAPDSGWIIVQARDIDDVVKRCETLGLVCEVVKGV